MSQSYTRPVPTTVQVARLDLSGGLTDYAWRVVSHCGVVKIFSTRDGCMIALAPEEARRLVGGFAEAMNDAADCTGVRSYGEVTSRRHRHAKPTAQAAQRANSSGWEST